MHRIQFPLLVEHLYHRVGCVLLSRCQSIVTRIERHTKKPDDLLDLTCVIGENYPILILMNYKMQPNRPDFIVSFKETGLLPNIIDLVFLSQESMSI